MIKLFGFYDQDNYYALYDEPNKEKIILIGFDNEYIKTWAYGIQDRTEDIKELLNNEFKNKDIVWINEEFKKAITGEIEP